MDTTSDSIDDPLAKNLASNNKQTATDQITQNYATVGIVSHDDEITRLPPDKLMPTEETPPSSLSSPSEQASNPTSSPPLPPPPQLAPSQSESSPSSALTAESTSATTRPTTSNYDSVTTRGNIRNNLIDKNHNNRNNNNNNNNNNKKSVIFDKVTVFHFNRSQGFTSIPSQGGSTLGMKSRHFLRRRLSVDLYEEVRRRSRREILLKIKFEKRRRDGQQELCDDRLHSNSTSSSTSSASNATNTSDSDDESYSDFSDISDSELESDSYIFLQPVGVKLRRSLLRASGIGRIDPKEKKDCKLIRESRERSGCSCVDQCIPEYCECSRLGVNCHVDRISFPCGCNSVGCRNPNGRTEFDVARVRDHFEEKVIRSPTSEDVFNEPSIHQHEQ